VRLVRLSTERCSWPGARALTIGGFDGLHVGHQELIRRARFAAQRLALPAAVLSFEPLPREFLQPEHAPARLTNFRERWHVLQSLALDEFLIMRFDTGMAHMSAADFMQLLARVGARHVTVGHDFRFGHGGEGDVALMRARGPQLGFEVEVVAPVLLAGERVGSRMVREALSSGDLARAQRLLQRGYSMRGRVRRGAQLGRTLGFPTANIATHRRTLPFSGIFAVRVHALALAGATARAAAATGDAVLSGWPGVASLGTRPQVNGVEPLLEAHLFDFSGDLYGREIEVEFVAKLRDEQRFDSLDAMTAQMHRDAAAARQLLA
jgi:riboflavin kinase/FMN adenylyltransferase